MTAPAGRVAGPDVVRALALIGVVVMNFHGYLMFRGGRSEPGTWADVFDPFEGPLSTRFAATFVLIAGVGVTLMTRRAVTAQQVTEMRWRLVRRGLVLYVLGQVLDVIWSGTIIFYYGAMFVVAAALFTLASRWIVTIGLASALAGWAVNAWVFERVRDGGDVRWLLSPGRDTVRRFVLDLAINGTHPLLPWMAFLCAGMVVGRVLYRPHWHLWCAGLGAALFAVSAVVSRAADTPFTEELLSRHPFDRGIVYVASALGSSLVVVALVSFVAERATGWVAVAIDPLRRAGQMTLTLYVAHILVFNLLVDWLELVEPAGLGTALTFALGFWVIAIALGTVWHRRFGRGPLERIYRAIGG